MSRRQLRGVRCEESQCNSVNRAPSVYAVHSSRSSIRYKAGIQPHPSFKNNRRIVGTTFIVVVVVAVAADVAVVVADVVVVVMSRRIIMIIIQRACVYLYVLLPATNLHASTSLSHSHTFFHSTRFLSYTHTHTLSLSLSSSVLVRKCCGWMCEAVVTRQ